MKKLLCLLCLMMLIHPAALAQKLPELLTSSPLAGEIPLQVVNAPWQGETLTLTVERAMSDHNALAVSWQVNANTADPCYFALEKVYVNGMAVPLTRSVEGGANWLSSRASAGVFDMSRVPKAQSYTVAMSFLSLKPNGPVVYLPETDDSTDYVAYQQKIIDYNNQGCVVSTPEGRIQLSQDSYDPGMDYVYQLLAADKMLPWENPAVTFTLVPGAQSQTFTLTRDFENYGVMAKVSLSPLSLTATVTQTFSNTLSLEEAQQLLRRYAVTDPHNRKDWYVGGSQDMGELTRLADGAYQAVMTWSTQSLQSLPEKICLTPYAYDAYMSPVYEPENALTLEVKP